jgi:hypothetical protein
MKPSIKFDRWIAKNAAAIEQTPALKRLVAFTLLDLKMIEMNPKGVSPGTAQSITERLAGLRHALSVRGIPEPDLKLPKMKIVRPVPFKRKGK